MDENLQMESLYGHEFLYAGPLFIHQLSHMWIDFRGIQDEYMRGKAIDYFENTRRAIYAQQQYAIRNPKGFKGYCEYIWESPRAMVRDRQSGESMAALCAFMIMERAEFRMGRMTALSRRGP